MASADDGPRRNRLVTTVRRVAKRIGEFALSMLVLLGLLAAVLAAWGLIAGLYLYGITHMATVTVGVLLGLLTLRVALDVRWQLILRSRGVSVVGTVARVEKKTKSFDTGHDIATFTSYEVTISYRTADGVERTQQETCKGVVSPGQPCRLSYDPVRPDRAGFKYSLSKFGFECVALAALLVGTGWYLLWALGGGKLWS